MQKTVLKLDPCFKIVNKRLNLSGDQFHKNAISSVLQTKTKNRTEQNKTKKLTSIISETYPPPPI